MYVLLLCFPFHVDFSSTDSNIFGLEPPAGECDALINCVINDVGFSKEKHVAAFTIYKCLLHWKSFEAERTNVFDRLIQMIGSAIENHDDNDHMAYCRSQISSFAFKAAAHSICGKKMYGIIQDNLKKELALLNSLCIQAPRTSKGSVLRSGRSFGKDSPVNHGQSIIECLNTLLCTLKENFVPSMLVQKIFTQIFSYVNVQLFNSLLLHRECCTFSNGEYVKAGLAELEQWYCQAKEEYAGLAWDELKHIRQAVGFLVIHQKYRISYDEIINDLCPYGSACMESGSGNGDSEVQQTMLELLNQLDGFEASNKIKVPI